MPNQALQAFLKGSSWFPAFAETHGFRDLEEALQFYAVNAPMYGGLGVDRPSTVGAPTGPQGQVPGSLGEVASEIGTEAQQPGTIGQSVGSAIAGFGPAAGFGRAIGSAIGNLGFGVPVDEISMLGMGLVPTGFLNRVFSAMPRSLISSDALQSTRPDISDPAVQDAMAMDALGLTTSVQNEMNAVDARNMGVAPGPTDAFGTVDPAGVVGNLGAQAPSVDAPSIGPSPQYGAPQRDPSSFKDAPVGTGPGYSDKEGGRGPGTGGGYASIAGVGTGVGVSQGVTGGNDASGIGGGGEADTGSGRGSSGGYGFRGGMVRKRGMRGYAEGGSVRGIDLFGPDPPGPDDGAAYLDEGEMVMPAHAVRYHGLKKMMMMLHEAEENEDKGASMMHERREDMGMYRGGLMRPMKDVTPRKGYAMGGLVRRPPNPDMVQGPFMDEDVGQRYLAERQNPNMRMAAAQFDPEGAGYDLQRALQGGMTPAGPEAGENAGHMGSVLETTPDEQRQYGLPAESYLLLKGRTHETWDKAIAAEEARGFKVIKRGDRYFSIPAARRR